MVRELCLVIPAYNEADVLDTTVKECLGRLESLSSVESYQIIIAENGSEDNTFSLASKLSKNHEAITVLRCEPGGRGEALRESFRYTCAEVVCYLDADLATDMRCLKKLVNPLFNGYDLVVGSRYLADSSASRPFKRRIISKTYNYLVSCLFKTDVEDHQCGFKAFNRSTIQNVLPLVKDTRWFWDTEFLLRAQRKKYKVKEIPITWEAKPDSAVQLVYDTLRITKKLLQLRLEFYKQYPDRENN